MKESYKLSIKSMMGVKSQKKGVAKGMEGGRQGGGSLNWTRDCQEFLDVHKELSILKSIIFKIFC